ncbi:MAG: nucleotide sugar dehydrogenase [Anaerolineales bacterium]|nr:nucleotide sugar dehydrogenase [Anaerolineales bacterium]
MSIHTELLKKIEDRTAQIGIIGLGYVGLPLAVAFAEAGFTVTGIDVNQSMVDCLNQGQSHIEDIPSGILAPLVTAGKFRATTDYDAVAGLDTLSICVPTPLRKSKDPDISYIISSVGAIVQRDGKGKLLVLESTTYPGTTEEVVMPAFAEKGYEPGRDYLLAFSPERIDPGRTDYTIKTTPKVIGGVTPECTEVALALYGTVVDRPVPVSSPKAAEMVKLLENTFRAVNIGLVNEIALMCDKLGINVWEVVDAAATKPYGFMPFYPGPGLGGHCIPIDPLYLSWKLRTLNYTARFIELADEINKHMPDYVVTKVADALNDDQKSVRGSHILVLGVAYKPNVSDTRESPAIDIIHLLQEKGAQVTFHDPYVQSLREEHLALDSVALTPAVLQAADCAVVITNHKVFDWGLIGQHAQLVVDTRNAMPSENPARIVSL